jgi:hypothetical protein
MVANYGKQIDPGAAQSVTGDMLLNITRCSTYFGLADLGFGCPELGCFSLREIAALRLPFGLRIERDLSFTTGAPLSGWTNAARQTGSISAAETLLARAGEGLRSHPLPRSDPDRG